MISCDNVSGIATVGSAENHARVGEVLMKSRKSFTNAADVPFEAIVKGVVAEYDRTKTLGILWRLKRKILAIIDGLEKGDVMRRFSVLQIMWGSCLVVR